MKTEEQLEQRALELADEAADRDTEYWYAHRDATLVSLRIEQRCLPFMQHKYGCVHHGKGLGEQIMWPCTCGLESLLKELRDRLDNGTK